MENKNVINCPNCNTEINVNDLIYQKLQKEMDGHYNTKLKEQQDAFATKFEELEKEKALLKSDREKII